MNGWTLTARPRGSRRGGGCRAQVGPGTLRRTTLASLLFAAWSITAAASEPITFHSPGFSPTCMKTDGRLEKDWGTFGLQLSGEGLIDGATQIEAVILEGGIPAARSESKRGAVTLSCTAYRAPVFPVGVDVFEVRLTEAKNQPAQVIVKLDLPPGAKIGRRTVRLGNRTLLTQSDDTAKSRATREWGHCDEATAIPGWAKPEGECDPAFRNIRAGMGGVPISYRFTVPPRSEAQVVLGLCESHWAQPAQRPLVCRVEGAPPQSVDPVAKWGQHKPGVLRFKARDENGDGQLQIEVRPAPGAVDHNPILNAIWIFPTSTALDLGQVISGKLTAAASRYVAVGGKNDQSLYPEDTLEYPLQLPAGGTRELMFILACAGGSAPVPDDYDWPTAALRRAAVDVWRAWPKP